MLLRPTKSQAIKLVTEQAPQLLEVFKDFQASNGGWLTWPDKLLKIKKNLKADNYISACPDHLAALVRFALSTGCRAGEISNLEWSRVDLSRRTAWLNQTKNGTPRGVPLNLDAMIVLEEQLGKHPRACFTYLGLPIRRGNCNTVWYKALELAGLEDFRFHDLRHTWASWHRQAGTSCDELKDLGGWKTRSMVDRYAKFATENLAFAASRIELNRGDGNVISLSHFCHSQESKKASA